MGEAAVVLFIETHLYPHIATISKHPVKSYKTLVQEVVQKQEKVTPEYVDTEQEKQGKETVIYKSELLVHGKKKSE